MAEKHLNEIIADIVLLEQNIEAMHKNYIVQRETLVAPLREPYLKQRRKMERKRDELKGLLKDNVVNAVMNPGQQPKMDDELYGYSLVKDQLGE